MYDFDSKWPPVHNSFTYYWLESTGRLKCKSRLIKQVCKVQVTAMPFFPTIKKAGQGTQLLYQLENARVNSNKMTQNSGRLSFIIVTDFHIPNELTLNAQLFGSSLNKQELNIGQDWNLKVQIVKIFRRTFFTH